MKDFFQKRIIQPLISLLKQGTSPKELADCLSAGFIIGYCPILGICSPLAALVAALKKWNQVGIQIGNYSAYPAQLAMIIPFLKAGQWLFGSTPLPFSIKTMLHEFRDSPVLFFKQYGLAACQGFVVWFVVSIPLFFVLARVLRPLLEKLLVKIKLQG